MFIILCTTHSPIKWFYFVPILIFFLSLKRITRFELAPSAWKAETLPLRHIRIWYSALLANDEYRTNKSYLIVVYFKFAIR